MLSYQDFERERDLLMARMETCTEMIELARYTIRLDKLNELIVLLRSKASRSN